MIALDALQSKKVLVLGHTGLLGSAVVRQLQKVGADVQIPARRLDMSLPYNARLAIESFSPDYIISAIGYNGGIGFRKSFDIFSQNTSVPLSILRAMADVNSPAKVIFPVASCGYDEPNHAISNCDLDGNLVEDGYLAGSPHISVQPHGYAKRNTVLACRYASEQYGVKAVTVCLPTLFGINDRYAKDRSKFVAALIRKFVDAVDDGLEEVVLWGTGNPEREVMFADDAAHLLLQTLLKYDDSTLPLNISNGKGYSIKVFAMRIAQAVGYCGRIVFDSTKVDGQMRKLVSYKRQVQCLGGIPPMIDWGIAFPMTVADYRERKQKGLIND